MAAKRSNRKGCIDEGGPSAATVYGSRRADIAALLDWLDIELDKSAEYVEKEGVDFGHSGDLGHVRNLLVQTLAFLAQRDEEDIKGALADAAAGRKE